MVMFFAARHPRLVDKAMSLDHRRMKMPRIRKLRLYTLRGRDDEAEGECCPQEGAGGVSYKGGEAGGGYA